MSDLEALRSAWEAARDGETGHEYGEALEEAGRVDEAFEVYTEMFGDGWAVAAFDLAWLEHDRGNGAVARSLLENYLAEDDDADEYAGYASGVLGHWWWHEDERFDAEPLLRVGADFYQSARVDLARLLMGSDREDEGWAVLGAGVGRGELQSYLPLALLHDERGLSDEAERLYRLGYSLGDPFCAFNLSTMLRDQGRTDEARQWMWLAAQGGDDWAIRRLADVDV